MAHRYLSFTDRTGEIAFAVLMVIIINGYVALSDLNSGFLYIVAVNLGACVSWGFIDGFIYAISSSIERNNLLKRLTSLKQIATQSNGTDQKELVGSIEKRMSDDDFFSAFNDSGKEAIAKNILVYAPQASVEKHRLFIKEEVLGWISIILIYLAVGFLLALPFLILPNKLFAWLISNTFGAVWLFWYGIQLGRSIGKYRIVLGFAMSAIGILFLIFSYIVWTQ